MKYIVDMHDSHLPPEVVAQIQILQARDERGREALALQGRGEIETTDGEALMGAPLMNRWSVEAYAYSQEGSVSLSFLSRLLGAKLSDRSCGIVCEARRYTTVIDGGVSIDIGVAVRISAAIEKLRAGVQLNLPNLAASAQIDNSEGRIEMTVLGYVGPLGALLPSPRQLSVDCYVDYMKAFARIQEYMFGPDGSAYHSPTALTYDLTVLEDREIPSDAHLRRSHTEGANANRT